MKIPTINKLKIKDIRNGMRVINEHGRFGTVYGMEDCLPRQKDIMVRLDEPCWHFGEYTCKANYHRNYLTFVSRTNLRVVLDDKAVRALARSMDKAVLDRKRVVCAEIKAALKTYTSVTQTSSTSCLWSLEYDSLPITSFRKVMNVLHAAYKIDAYGERIYFYKGMEIEYLNESEICVCTARRRKKPDDMDSGDAVGRA